MRIWKHSATSWKNF